ncbi:hypothetical protein KTO58_19755 [Chitinophaga pendula]|uniref:hypothetical protein n=1 Tax=Chitinophaga TaxID=79328 RepID=UPI000BB0780D|nr:MULTISPECIES: hypothetical protein [Chitinophaga]ASZ11096.1 hypothetical protein CK934_09045 [Chitinophaga sp. MD30]UCJ05906.1 hypothetical protein KTO58_19755 [Chitinophaga pendula]
MTNIDQAQIDAWKAEYEEVWRLTVAGKVGFLKMPTRKILSYAYVAAKTDPFKFPETIINECWIAGDEELKTNDKLLMSASAHVEKMVQMEEAELVKL